MAHQMLNDEQRELASLFSMGMLEPEESKAFEAHLTDCHTCASEVQQLRTLYLEVSATIADDLTAALPAELPPPRLKENLMQLITAESASQPIIKRANEGRWRTILPGVEVKRLFVDPVTKSVTSLVRVAKDAVYPAHLHVGVEHLYVLDGDIIFDDHTLADGDYEVRLPDSKHSAARTVEGCTLLVINSGKDEFLV